MGYTLVYFQLMANCRRDGKVDIGMVVFNGSNLAKCFYNSSEHFIFIYNKVVISTEVQRNGEIYIILTYRFLHYGRNDDLTP